MALTTCAVTATLRDPEGVVLAGAVVEARLSGQDRDGGLVVPRVVRGTADANGVVTLALWPNSRGSAGTVYSVKVSSPGARTLRFENVQVPDQASANLKDIVDLGPPPTVSDAEAAELAAQGYASSASASATSAGNSATAAGASATAAAADAVATDADRIAVAAAKASVDASEANVIILAGEASADAAAADAARIAAEAARDLADADAAATAVDRTATETARTQAQTAETNAASSASDADADRIAAEQASADAEAWAESATAPGNSGTKSSKTWAGEASVSAGNAATSEANAAGSELAAAGHASDAAISEANAATFETAAGVHAGAAINAQAGAESARDGAQALYGDLAAVDAAKTAAEAAATAADGDRVDAEQAQAASESARDLAETHAISASGSAATALSAAALADSRADSAESARNEAVSAAGSLVNLGYGAADLLQAVSDAESHRDSASSSAALADADRIAASEHADRAETAEANAFAIADSDMASALLSYGITNVADVFVYDTSKDDDPDWIHKATWQSWYGEDRPTGSWLGAYGGPGGAVAAGGVVGDYYWETGNQRLAEITATGTPASTVIYRGSKAQFPRTAILIAQSGGAQDNLIILDADDPELPVWMVFDADTSSNDLFYNVGVFGVKAKNGVLIALVGSTLTNIYPQIVDFVRDGATYVREFDQKRYNGNIAERNDALGTSAVPGGQAIADSTNDIALYLDPLAPIDPATGMRRPVIACFTDGGVSVIQEDGTVRSSSRTTAFNSGAFGPDGTLYATGSSSGAFVHDAATWRAASFSEDSRVFYSNEPAGGPSNGSGYQSAYVGKGFFGSQRRFANDVTAGLFLSRPGAQLVGSDATAIVLAEDHAIPPFRKAALALALASTETTDLVGATPEEDLIAYADKAALDAAATLVESAASDIVVPGDGTVVLTHSSGSVQVAWPISLTPGHHYALEYQVEALNASFEVQARIGSGAGLSQSLNVQVSAVAIASPGEWQRIGSFAATASSTWHTVTVLATPGRTITLGGWRLRRIEPDRSGNGNGPVVVGTMRRPSMGDDTPLTAYQPSTSANGSHGMLSTIPSFGAGDFALHGVFYVPGASTHNFLGQWDGVGETFRLEVSGGLLRSVPITGFATHGSVPASRPVAFTYQRRAGVIEVWTDGRLLDSLANTEVFDFSSDALWIGAHPIRGSINTAWLGLFDAEDVALTVEEVREKHRIMLAWTRGDPTLLSDTVDAIGYDEDDDLISVSGPSGTTVLHGSTLTRARTHTSADANLTSDDHNAVAGSGGVSVIASANEVRLSLPALALRDKLLSSRRIEGYGTAVQRAATTDATPTVVAAVPLAEGERLSLLATVRAYEPGNLSGERAYYGRIPIEISRGIGGNLTADFVGSYSLDESTASMALAVAANVTDQLLEFTGTGVAGTPLVWETSLEIQPGTRSAT